VNGVKQLVPYLPFIFRAETLRKYHLTLGHLAANTMYPILYSRFYWPSLVADCKEFVSQCSKCQLNTAPDVLPPRPLNPTTPVGLPFTKWGIDFIQDVPKTSDGFENIITAVDLATKYTIAKPVKSRDAATVANFIFEEICCRFGAPRELITDRAKSFLDSVLAKYLAILDIHHLPSTPYTPRTNGCCERMHRTLKDILTKLCASDRLRWIFYLP